MDTIIKVCNKTENFTVICNEVARRTDLSARAKGIYFYLMTLPPDWEIHKSEIYSHFTEGRDALNNAFIELENAGYIKKEEIREKGKFVAVKYTVYESTVNGKPVTGKPSTDNPHLLNTDSTNHLLTNNISTKEPPNGEADAFNDSLSLPTKKKKRHKDADWYTDEINLERLEYITNFFKENTDYAVTKETRHYLKDIVDNFTNQDDNTFMDDDFVTAFYKYKETKDPYWSKGKRNFVGFYKSIGMV